MGDGIRGEERSVTHTYTKKGTNRLRSRRSTGGRSDGVGRLGDGVDAADLHSGVLPVLVSAEEGQDLEPVIDIFLKGVCVRLNGGWRAGVDDKRCRVVRGGHGWITLTCTYVCICTHIHAYALEVGEDDVAPRVQLQDQVARALAHPEGEAHHAVRAQLLGFMGFSVAVHGMWGRWSYVSGSNQARPIHTYL